MSIAVALDGPAGAGKSSIAKRAAAALDFIYVDTGALYRTIGLAASRRGVEPVASPEARAQRRYKELVEKGMDVKYEDILQDVITRDYNDTHRETAPLKPAEGCVMVDTTELDLEQSIEKIISVIEENI